MQDVGLSSASAHFDYVGFESKIDYGRQLGLEYMVCPMLPKNLWTSAEGFREAAAKFNTWGKLVHDAGMTFAFHNHDYEFKPQGNTTGFAEFMQHTDPALVKLEFDLYWLTQGGQDPAAMLTKYANRARLIHLKDRKPNTPPATTWKPLQSISPRSAREPSNGPPCSHRPTNKASNTPS